MNKWSVYYPIIVLLVGILIIMNYTYAIGEIAVKYETSGRGPGFISDGDKWDPGGTSYGSYQLALTPGTLKGFLRDGSTFAEKLAPFTPNTRSFNDEWHRLAAGDPEGFKQAQFDYVMKISFLPARRYADRLGWPDNLAINSALFSCANQHGGWRKIMDDANVHKDDSVAVIVNKFYDARARYIESLNSPKMKKIKANLIKNRTIDERKDVLSLVGG